MNYFEVRNSYNLYNSKITPIFVKSVNVTFYINLVEQQKPWLVLLKEIFYIFFK